MAQERNEVKVSGSETAEIRGEIERTRVEMGETLVSPISTRVRSRLARRSVNSTIGCVPIT